MSGPTVTGSTHDAASHKMPLDLLRCNIVSPLYHCRGNVAESTRRHLHSPGTIAKRTRQVGPLQLCRLLDSKLNGWGADLGTDGDANLGLAVEIRRVTLKLI